MTRNTSPKNQAVSVCLLTFLCVLKGKRNLMEVEKAGLYFFYADKTTANQVIFFPDFLKKLQTRLPLPLHPAGFALYTNVLAFNLLMTCCVCVSEMYCRVSLCIMSPGCLVCSVMFCHICFNCATALQMKISFKLTWVEYIKC